MIGAPYRTRTGVFAVRGRRPGPLDEGSVEAGIAPIGHVRKHADVLEIDLLAETLRRRRKIQPAGGLKRLQIEGSHLELAVDFEGHDETIVRHRALHDARTARQ